MKLLSKTLAAIDDSQWTGQLAVEATRYLPNYNNSLEEKVSLEIHLCPFMVYKKLSFNIMTRNSPRPIAIFNCHYLSFFVQNLIIVIAAVLIIHERTKPVTVSWYPLNALCKRFAIQE